MATVAAVGDYARRDTLLPRPAVDGRYNPLGRGFLRRGAANARRPHGVNVNQKPLALEDVMIRRAAFLFY
jgi:hypothetical protein